MYNTTPYYCALLPKCNQVKKNVLSDVTNKYLKRRQVPIIITTLYCRLCETKRSYVVMIITYILNVSECATRFIIGKGQLKANDQNRYVVLIIDSLRRCPTGAGVNN